MSDNVYHKPVLLSESLEYLGISPEGVYVDVTFGGGGHSRELLKRLGESGQLIGFDQDEDAKQNIIEDKRFKFAPANFQYLKRYLKLFGITQVDGILADLGVSSYQLDQEDRGFSYRFEAELDMRMHQGEGMTAADLLNKYEAGELQRVFSEFGEVRNSKTLASAIVEARKVRPFVSTSDFLSVLEPLIKGNRLRYLSQVFQALRIEVNKEMEVLESFLVQALEVLKPGGRLVVISYHSLEDRMVKNFLKSGNVQGQVVKDFYGNIERPFELVTRKVVEATNEELKLNPRARSAKLRAGEKK
ncbi:MAG: 16S rRNA (cytosine(1402)-N(4))-methyltransferase RsmH [Saprospiraceae bacterium]